MSEQDRQEDVFSNNERSLQQLAWAIEASVGQFKLILVRCNYANWRRRLVERLREISKVEIRIIVLQEEAKTLHTAIRKELGEEVPASLMVLGLESVQDLPQMLALANQVREEFRNKFHFPLVLWIDDEIHKQMMQLAPDLESWATTKNFVLPFDELIDFLQQLAEQFLTSSSTLALQDCRQIKLAWQDFQNFGQVLEPEVQADCDFLQGLVEYFNNQLDAAIEYYQLCLAFWQERNDLERQGKILGHITFCDYERARKSQQFSSSGTDWSATRNSLRQCLEAFEAAECLDFVANSIDKFGIIIRDLEDWAQLKILAERALKIHKNQGNSIEIIQDYVFLSEVALAEQKWLSAKELSQKSLEILSDFRDQRQRLPNQNSPDTFLSIRRDEFGKRSSYLQSLSLFILAFSQENVNESLDAIGHLETARRIGVTDSDPQLYIKILRNLQRLYFEQKQYLEAYKAKLERRSIEQQYGLRTFIGAGRLEATRQAFVKTRLIASPQLTPSSQEKVALEITASGRQLDVERLLERIGRPDYKLIVIYGQSGVGKSSLVNAGLVPALKKEAIGTQDNLPIVIRVYTNWVEELAKSLVEVMGSGEVEEEDRKAISSSFPHSPLPTPYSLLLDKLRESESQNLRPVIIFDQFEEFFFVETQPRQRRQFFEFLGECLNILPVKVVLSLREDYLHYLLKCNRLPSMNIVVNDILSKNVLYELGNFAPTDAKEIIQQLTNRSHFHLEPVLIDELVKDLAGTLEEVRPIELQVVGAQLQADNITTLTEYRQRGPKEELVKRYLAEVVKDCGQENQQLAELVLYLLTDEKGTRPLKTRTELEQDLHALAIDITTEASKLNLVLEIFVKSGLLVLVPENPTDRYQLVHDYIAAFIRQQQEPKLTTLMGELAREKEQRKLSDTKLNRFLKRALFGSAAAGLVLAVLALTAWNSARRAEMQTKQAQEERKQAQISEIKALTNSSEAFFASGQTLDALVEALKAGGKLKLTPWAQADSQVLTLTALEQAVYLQPKEYTFREHNRLEGHSSPVSGISFSPDGKTLASASDDKTIKIWDTSTGKQLQTLTGHSSSVNSVSFSPNGKTLASACSDNTIKIWDTSTGKQLKTLTGHSSSVNSVSFSPDGKTLASASSDSTIKIWETSTGKQLKTLTGHSSRVSGVSFSPDSKTLASASSDSTIKIWETSTGKQLKTLTGHSSRVSGVSFSPDGKTLASASTDHTIKIWETSTGKQLKTLTGHSSRVSGVSFSPNGKTLASASTDNTVKIWDTSTGKLLQTLSGHSSYVWDVSFSPDGKTLASASGDSTIKIWKTSTGKQLKILTGHSDHVWGVNFSPDGKTLASASDDKTIKIWDTSTGKQLQTLTGHSSSVNSVSFSPNGKTLASACSDNTIKIWDTSTGKQLKTLTGHSSSVNSVSFSPDGKTLASANNDYTIRIWETSTGKQLKTLTGHSSSVWDVSFSPDGKTLASASADHTIKIWETSTGKQLKTLTGHSGPVRGVSFSPDGKILASASYDYTIRIWETSTGKLLKTFNGHSSSVLDVRFSPDGKTLASASFDGTIKIWETSTGKQLKTLTGHSSVVMGVSFSPDGKTLASASQDKTVILWDFNLNELLISGCNSLKDYLAIHPNILEELKECQTQSILMQAAPLEVIQGEELAKTGDIDNAIIKFHNALKWNPNLKFDPNAKAQEFARKGQAEQQVIEGKTLVREDKVKQAVADYTQAQQLDPKVEINAESWRSLCWYGSLNKQAADVMFACEKAVVLDSDNRVYRGLARALTGNTSGAIEDFEAYIIISKNKESKVKVQSWVKALHSGKNPFTDAELRELHKQDVSMLGPV